MNKEAEDIETYRWPLVGKTILEVEFSDADEGLVLTLNDGSILDFGFSSGYGSLNLTGAWSCGTGKGD